MFLQPDGTFWIQLISFGVFLVALNAVFLKPVGEAIKRRRAYIDGVKADLERYESQISRAEADAAHQRGTARRAADERLLKARAEAEAKAADLARDAAARAPAMTAAAPAIVATEVAAARIGGEERARELAGVLLARAVGSSAGASPAPGETSG